MSTAYVDKNNTVIKENKNEKTSIWGWIQFFMLVGALFFVFRYAIGIQLISGDSMNPTIENGNAVFISKLLYTADKGDLVVAADPYGSNIIKRVIATSNDTVAISEGIVYVNGKSLNESYTKGIAGDMEPISVPEGEYFVLGDNRTPGESLDSREASIGTFSKDELVGKVLFSLLPPKLF